MRLVRRWHRSAILAIVSTHARRSNSRGPSALVDIESAFSIFLCAGLRVESESESRERELRARVESEKSRERE